MSQYLAQLLNKPESATTAVIARLEDLSGYPSQDVRFLSEVEIGLRHKIADLHLDPDDTTAQELYHAIMVRLEKDTAQFAKATNRLASNEQAYIKGLINLVGQSAVSREVWVLKRTIAKDLLRARKPRKLMKYLGYRSLESMLKRESVAALYAALPLVESASLIKRLRADHTNLKSDHFESRSIELITSSKELPPIASKSAIVTCVPELGAAVVWSIPRRAREAGPSLIALFLQAIEVLRLRSASFKLQQFKPDFGKEIFKILEGNSPVARVAGEPISWRALHRHFGKQSLGGLPDFFDPYIQAGDLHHQIVPDLLAHIHPAFRWWASANHLGLNSKEVPVSLNLVDVVSNYLHKPSHKYASRSNFQQALWDELIGRYLAYPGVENHIMQQLDKGSWALETVPANTADDNTVQNINERQPSVA